MCRDDERDRHGSTRRVVPSEHAHGQTAAACPSHARVCPGADRGERPARGSDLVASRGASDGRRARRHEPHAAAAASFAAEYVGHIDDVVPGTASSFNGNAWLDLWTRDPWTNGAYAAFLPGQYTRLWGYTGRAEGRVHFAGEHTSTYSQGYLNGGVESGQRAAIEFMGELGIDVPPSIADLPYSELG